VDIALGVTAATAAAVFFATADFSGAIVSRRVTPLSAALSVQVVSGAGLAVVLVATGDEMKAAALGIGLLSGLGVGIGLLALYQALAAGAIGLVAVITGVAASALTLGFDVALAGRAPTPVQVAGIACATAGAAVSGTLGVVTRRVAMLSIIAGCAFGSSFIGFNLASEESPIAVLFAARLAAIALLGSAWAISVPRRFTLRPLIALAGVLDTFANGLMLFAVSLMPVSLATAISSADPPIIIMFLGRVLLKERLPRLAYASVALASAGIALMFIG
jgi:drug/metabolite transporter (DMT)-like permease